MEDPKFSVYGGVFKTNYYGPDYVNGSIAFTSKPDPFEELSSIENGYVLLSYEGNFRHKKLIGCSIAKDTRQDKKHSEIVCWRGSFDEQVLYFFVTSADHSVIKGTYETYAPYDSGTFEIYNHPTTIGKILDQE